MFPKSGRLSGHADRGREFQLEAREASCHPQVISASPVCQVKPPVGNFPDCSRTGSESKPDQTLSNTNMLPHRSRQFLGIAVCAHYFLLLLKYDFLSPDHLSDLPTLFVS